MSKKKKKRSGGEIFLSVMKLLNMALMIALAVYNHRQTVKAVQNDEKTELLFTGKKETRPLD